MRSCVAAGMSTNATAAIMARGTVRVTIMRALQACIAMITTAPMTVAMIAPRLWVTSSPGTRITRHGSRPAERADADEEQDRAADELTDRVLVARE